jgi:hypothetical protein
MTTKTTAQILREHAMYGTASAVSLIPWPYSKPWKLVMKDWPVGESIKYVELRMLMFFLAESLENPC